MVTNLNIERKSVPLVNDSVGEEVSSLLTFSRDLARKFSPVFPYITNWSCLRERAVVFHRFHPAYRIDSALLDIDVEPLWIWTIPCSGHTGWYSQSGGRTVHRYDLIEGYAGVAVQ
ncbi:hypothetical protein BpHYR1_041192 [Brachionus plicatilis]|uniref:Uncharacterized protein n=1 Tax=Brachionus plicatilis TaxID=10195 RepID=A0A3M7T9M5_BRAPC|nr:hypothetical protein BpHYR1_041192 [Brachionus plicatilis]